MVNNNDDERDFAEEEYNAHILDGERACAAEDGHPCCGGTGYLLRQEYGFADIPDGWIPVQRCDACQLFEGDDDAAKEAATVYATTFKFFDGEYGAPGDYAIHWHGPMMLPGYKRFRVEFVAPTTYVAHVVAQSESAARQAFIDGDVDEIGQLDDLPRYLDEFTSTEVIDVQED